MINLYDRLSEFSCGYGVTPEMEAQLELVEVAELAIGDGSDGGASRPLWALTRQ